MRLSFSLVGFFILSVLLPGVSAFKGEIFKVSRYSHEIICRAPDLTSLEIGQKLYAYNGKGDLIAEMAVTRYYITIVETTLVSGNRKALQVGMPVYTELLTKKPEVITNIIKYVKDYDYYWWNAVVYYKTKESTPVYRPVKLIVPKIISLTGLDYDEPIKIDSEEVSSFSLYRLFISGIQLKDGEQTKLQNIDFGISSFKIPEEVVVSATGNDRMVLNYLTATQVVLLQKNEGADEKSVAMEKENVKLEGFLRDKAQTYSESQIDAQSVFLEFDRKLSGCRDSPEQMVSQSNYLYKLAMLLTESEKKQLWDSHFRKDQYSGCCLNFLFPGLGSIYQGDFIAGKPIIAAQLLGVAITIYGMILENTPVYSVNKDGSGMTAKAAGPPWAIYGVGEGLIVLASAFSMYRAHSYINHWNRRLKKLLQQDFSGRVGLSLNGANGHSNKKDASWIGMDVPIIRVAF